MLHCAWNMSGHSGFQHRRQSAWDHHKQCDDHYKQRNATKEPRSASFRTNPIGLPNVGFVLPPMVNYPTAKARGLKEQKTNRATSS